MSANPIVLPPSNLPAKLLQMPFVDPQTGMLTQEWRKVLSAFLSALRVQALLLGTHAQRATVAAASRPVGTLYFETDRGVYYISQSSTWKYFSGYFSVPQDSLPTDLGAADIGFLAYVNDYAHLLQWTWNSLNSTGAWTWAPGELGSDYSVPFVTGPDVTTGWHACDGSAVLRLVSDGTLANATTPNTAGSWYRQ